MRTIKVKLEPHSIAQAIEEINTYRDELEKKVRVLLKTITDRGVRIAQARVVDHFILYDNTLSSSIHGYVQGNRGFISVDDKNAVWFEFGTGPVGAKDPHPLSTGYADEGWWTAADGKDMETLYGWEPFGTDGDTFYFTYGQPAKPFMYETAQRLRELFPKMAAEVFK